jgi:hypothetical protein
VCPTQHGPAGNTGAHLLSTCGTSSNQFLAKQDHPAAAPTSLPDAGCKLPADHLPKQLLRQPHHGFFPQQAVHLPGLLVARVT